MMKNNDSLKKKRLFRKIKLIALGTVITLAVLGLLFWIFVALGMHLGNIASNI